MSQLKQTGNQFYFVQTRSDIVSQPLAQPHILRNNPLGPGTMEAGLQYTSGIILARVTDVASPAGFYFVNCDPADADAEKKVAYAILFDDHIEVNDEVGAGVQDEYVYAARKYMVLKGSMLYATKLDQTDVAAAMATMGAQYDPMTDEYFI